MSKKIKKLDEVEKVETTEEVKPEETTEAETLPKVEFKEEITPKGYSPIIHKEDKKQVLKMKDGKVYQEIGNGLGMFLADGKVFRL